MPRAGALRTRSPQDVSNSYHQLQAPYSTDLRGTRQKGKQQVDNAPNGLRPKKV